MVACVKPARSAAVLLATPARQTRGPMPPSDNLPRRYSDDEVSEILKHATDLQAEESPQRHSEGTGMTLAEIQEIAAEVGIDPRHLQQAAARIDRPKTAGFWAKVAGGPAVVSVERVVPGELSEADFARIVPEIQRVSLGHGNATLVGSTLTWSSETTQRQRTAQVTVASQDGETLIRAEESLHGMMGGLFGGLVGGGGVGLGVGVGLPIGIEAIGSAFFAVAFPLATVSLFYGVARTIVKSITQKRRRALEELVDHIARQVPSATALPEERTALPGTPSS